MHSIGLHPKFKICMGWTEKEVLLKMNKSILLLQLPHIYGKYGGIKRLPEDMPLGIGYLIAVLKNAGYKVGLLDIWGRDLNNEQVIDSIKKVLPEYDLCGISAYSTQYSYFTWIIKEIKKIKDIPIIVGGPLATHSSHIIEKRPEVDFIVLGEGEISIVNLLKNIDSPQNVFGIGYKKDGKLIINQEQDAIRDLDMLPLPDREMFDVESYIKNTRSSLSAKRGFRILNMISSRGCPYRCRYCSKTFKYARTRSIDSVIREIQFLKEKYRVNYIKFNDELVLFNKKRGMELSEKIKPLNIKWKCQGRVNVVDLELLKAMKAAGCVAIGYGIESGSQRILNNMNKKATVEQNYTAIEITRKTGIEIIVQTMFGYIGEDEESIKETTSFCIRCGIKAGPLFPVVPLPGTDLYSYAIKHNLIKDEVDYHMNLDSGYSSYSSANLTQWTNSELVRKRRRLRNKINNYYYKSHKKEFLYDQYHKFLSVWKNHSLLEIIQRIFQRLRGN